MSLEKSFSDRISHLLKNLKDESDRAVIIIISAHIDVQLEEILRVALVPSSTSSDSMFDGPNAPLANLSNKIDFCYRLGLMSEFTAQSLHKIRKLRNKFAHNIEGCNFIDPSIKSSIEELYKLHQYDQKEKDLHDIFGDSPKGKFLLSATLVMGVMEEAYHRLGAIKPESSSIL